MKFSPALPISAGLLDTATWSTDHSAMELQQCFLIAQLLILVHVSASGINIDVANRFIHMSLIMIIAHYWKIVQKLGINHFYTTPYVIRKLMSCDKGTPTSYDLSSLRVIASGKLCSYTR